MRTSFSNSEKYSFSGWHLTTAACSTCSVVLWRVRDRLDDKRRLPRRSVEEWEATEEILPPTIFDTDDEELKYEEVEFPGGDWGLFVPMLFLLLF